MFLCVARRKKSRQVSFVVATGQLCEVSNYWQRWQNFVKRRTLLYGSPDQSLCLPGFQNKRVRCKNAMKRFHSNALNSSASFVSADGYSRAYGCSPHRFGQDCVYSIEYSNSLSALAATIVQGPKSHMGITEYSHCDV